MSLGEADSKFPDMIEEDTGIPPSPTRENPGAVHPKSDPNPGTKEDVPGTGTPNTNHRTVLDEGYPGNKVAPRDGGVPASKGGLFSD